MTIRFPIALPAHCIEVNTSKTNRTVPLDIQQLPCLSFCGNEIGKSNQVVADVPEAPEFPDTFDIIETSTSFKLQPSTTAKPAQIENNLDVSELAMALGGSQNPAPVEQTTVKERTEINVQKSSASAEKIINIKKKAIQVDQPIEIQQASVMLPSNFTDKMEFSSSEKAADLSTIQKKLNKAKESHDANVELKQQEFEPENDIKTTFNKKVDGIEVPKSATANIEPLPSYTTLSQIGASAPTHAIPIEPINPGCFLIFLAFRSESLNITIGRDVICHNFNITYNIPLSKYMKENRFEIVFM